MPHAVSAFRSAAPPAARDHDPRLLHEFFTRAARRWPGNVAVEVPPGAGRPARRTVTYAELDQRSDALANDLREVVAGECVVAILLPRTAEHVYLAQLAALKAGAAYCCIDPTFPDAQVATILADARPVAILTDAAGLARLRGLAPHHGVVLDVAGRHPAGGTAEPPAPAEWLTPRSLAYVVYTSGTTGKPKGVMIEHGAAANLVRGDLATFPVSPADRVGQNSSCAYDSSVEEIWMALAAGATLVVMDDDTTRLGPDLLPWLRNERVTIFSPPPTLLRATGCQHPEKELPLVRRVHVGGEPLPPDVAARWAPGRELLNDYGPTECTVVALRAVVAPGDPITIGRPLPGLRAWVLDEHLEEVAPGETGELCLGGVGLARGYVNDPALTARKFPTHPRLGRVYRTGDLAHRDAAGNFFCHGRIDTQVKVRGYRIELEAIEARLAACPGVRAAACRVQGDGPGQQIVAFVVPADATRPPPFDELKAALRAQLPAYMVPSHFGLLAALPTSVSGKLDRRALPALEVHAPEPHGRVVAPRDATEEKVAAAFRRVLGLAEPFSVDHDFFHDLGGDSLRAAGVISVLRDDPATAALAVRDLYEARTAEGLAKRARPVAAPPTQARPPRPTGRPLLATLAQMAWLLAGLVLAGPAAYFVAFQGIPDLTRELGLAPFVLAAPLFLYAGVGLYAVAAVAFAVTMKKLLIGRYRPLRAPVWGGFYVRNWMVTRAVRLIPWRVVEGTVFFNAVLRLLGAKIGRRVHIHHGVNLFHGGWDLLDLGDDVTLLRDAAVRVVDLDDGQIVVAPVRIGAGCTLEARAAVAGGAALDPGAYLTAHAAVAAGATVPAGECWAGIPAAPAGRAPEPPALPPGTRELSPFWFGVALVAGRLLLGATAAVPLALAALVLGWARGIGADEAVEWLFHPTLDAGDALLGAAAIVLATPLMLAGRCLSMRTLGRVREGVVSRWGWGYVRITLKADILDAATEWLSGSLLWPVWLRGAGMTIGRNSELSTVSDPVPELVEVGADTFFADGIYLAAPVVHRGTVTLARTTLGSNVFLGNYAVIPAGAHAPDGVLLGVCTVADDSVIRPGTSWFGHPPFELPKREVVEAARELTHAPSRLRYAHRVFWELLRFATPLPPAALVLAWFYLVGRAEGEFSLPVLVFGVVPLLDLGLLAALAALGLALKWALLGRVRPATHALWSGWCFRWDFHYTAWRHWCYAPLGPLEGTLLINWYLRAMGVRVGRGAVLGDVFGLVVDPDMISVADGATVGALFQAHTFEDRVLKIDRVAIGPAATVGTGALLLYGADVGEAARVEANSVVMKNERLQPARTYAGCPTRLVG